MKWNWVIYWFWLQIKTALRTAFQTITLGAYHTNVTLWKLKQVINIPMHSGHYYLFALEKHLLNQNSQLWVHLSAEKSWKREGNRTRANMNKWWEHTATQPKGAGWAWCSLRRGRLHCKQKGVKKSGTLENQVERYGWMFSSRSVKGRDELQSTLLHLPEALRHEIIFSASKESSQFSCTLDLKKKRKDSPWQGVIWSTWSNRLFLCQSVLLQILTLPPYASADQSSSFQNLCRDGFPAPCRRAEGSEQEGDKPGRSQLLLCVGRCVSVLKPERLSWCTVTSGFCKMPFFIAGSLQRAAASQPVRLCGGRTTRAASLIDEQRWFCTKIHM